VNKNSLAIEARHGILEGLPLAQPSHGARMNPFRRSLQLLCAAVLACGILPAQVPLAPGLRQGHPDHHEFEAALWAPFRGEQGEGRTLKVAFGFVDAATGTVGSWRLDLVDAKGRVRRQWWGEALLAGGSGSQTVAWDGRDAQGAALEPGFYTLRLAAKPMAQEAWRKDPGGSQADRVEAFLAASPEPAATQETSLVIGAAPRLRVRGFDAPPRPGRARRPRPRPRGAFPTPSTSATSTARPTTPTAACPWAAARAARCRRPGWTAPPPPSR